MATRRSTRRSSAVTGGLDQENDVEQRVAPAGKLKTTKAETAPGISKNTANQIRPRSAFTDVSNVRGARNANASASTSAAAVKPALKVTTDANGAKPTTYRTRSSMSGIKEENEKAAEVKKPSRPLRAKSSNIPSKTTAKSITTTKSTEPAVVNKNKGKRQAETEAELDDEAHRPKRSRPSDPHADHKLQDSHVDVEEDDDEWDDLDEGDEDDPLMVSTYVVEIYDYLRKLELTTQANPEYMSTQDEVTWKMRGILVDWLIEIHSKFRLLPETIFLAVNIVDRFLSLRNVSLVKFQLVGIASLFIASKYEEVVCPSISNFLYMTDGGYDEDEMLRAERYILQQLDFNMSYPNPINFLRRISKADGYDISSRTMAKYFMEISTVDHAFLNCVPSVIAAAATWLARRVLGKGPWDANLRHYSGYTEEQLKPTAQLMLDYVARNSSLGPQSGKADDENPLKLESTESEHEHPNFVKKYSAKKFYKAFCTVRQWVEEEYAPIECWSKEERKIVKRTVPIKL